MYYETTLMSKICDCTKKNLEGSKSSVSFSVLLVYKGSYVLVIETLYKFIGESIRLNNAVVYFMLPNNTLR